MSPPKLSFLRDIFHFSKKPEASEGEPWALTEKSESEQEKKQDLMSTTAQTSGRGTLRRAWKLMTPYWKSDQKWKAGMMLGAVVGLTLAQVYIDVQLNNWRGDFWDSIQNYKQNDFNHLLGTFSGWAGAWIGAVGYSQYLQQKLQMNWRRWTTKQSIDKWMDKKAYYDIQQNGGPKADNPDQRISDDINVFTDRTLNMGLGVLRSAVTLVSFTGLLYGMSGSLDFNVASHHVSIPHYLVPTALAYAAAGTWLTNKIGKKLPGLNYQQQRREADFRASALRVRENAESIALYGGEKVEKERLSQRFNRVVHNYMDIIKKQKQLTMFNSFYGQAAVIFPYVAVAGQYFKKAIKMGEMMQAVSAFGSVQGALSWFVDSFGQYADWKAAVDRLDGFSQTIEDSNKKQDGKMAPPAAAPPAVPPVRPTPGAMKPC